MNEAHPGIGGASIRLLVVIVNYKTAPLTIACLRALQSEVEAVPKIQVTVVDNASGVISLYESIQNHTVGRHGSRSSSRHTTVGLPPATILPSVRRKPLRNHQICFCC